MSDRAVKGNSQGNSDQKSTAEQAWRKEIEPRIDSIDNGTAKLVPWDEVNARLIRRIQQRTDSEQPSWNVEL